MAEITVLHNPRCSTSRHAVTTLAEAKVPAEVVEYLKTPLDRAALLDLLSVLEDPPAELVRKDAHFKELGLAAEDYTTRETVAELLAAHPRLMQRPVLRRGDRAMIGRPKERVREFLEGQ